MQPPVSACSEEPADLRSHGLQADAQACQIEEILFKKENTLYVPIISYGGEKLTTGRFHTLSDAELAHDLVTYKLSSISLQATPNLIHTLEWLQQQPMWSIMQEGSLEDLLGMLQRDPALLSSFPRRRPRNPAAAQVKVIKAAPTSSISWQNTGTTTTSAPSKTTTTSAAAPARSTSTATARKPLKEISNTHGSVQKEVKPVTAAPAQPAEASIPRDDDGQALAAGGAEEGTGDEAPQQVEKVEESGGGVAAPAARQPSPAPQTLSPSHVRTNWATFPEGSNHQAVTVTRSQINSGTMSIPVGRAQVVFGALNCCNVTIEDSKTGTVYTVGHKRYPSQPTQVFLQGLKAYFTGCEVFPNDVLCFRPLGRGACRLVCWPATAPEASAFRAHLRNGWSDITPPTERRPSVTRAPALSAPAAAQAGWKTPPTPQTSSLTTSSSSDSDGCADDSSDGVERVKARLTFSVKPDARLPRAAKQKALAMVATGAGAQDSPTSDPENNAMGGNGMNEGVKAGVRVGGAAKSAGQKAEATQGKGQKAARTGRGKGRCANVADGDQHKQTHRAQGNPGERRRPPTRGQTVTARQLDGAGHLSTRFPAHPDRLHHVRKQAAPKRAAEGEPDVQEYADAVAAAVQGLRRRKRAVVE